MAWQLLLAPLYSKLMHTFSTYQSARSIYEPGGGGGGAGSEVWNRV